MRTLRFHHELYSGEALEQARLVFDEHAELHLSQAMPYFEINVASSDEEIEEQVARELANYALALTIEEKRAGG